MNCCRDMRAKRGGGSKSDSQAPVRLLASKAAAKARLTKALNAAALAQVSRPSCCAQGVQGALRVVLLLLEPEHALLLCGSAT